MDFMNRWITPESVLWTAAVVSLLLLALSRPVSVVWISGRRDGVMRVYRVLLYICVFFLVFFPCLVLISGETVKGTPCGLYLLFFSLFCYYLGKNIGMEKGRRGIADLMGLDAANSIEEAQDRLFESRMRLPGRNQVVESITTLSAVARQSTGIGAVIDDAGGDDEIMDVAVEEL